MRTRVMVGIIILLGLLGCGGLRAAATSATAGGMEISGLQHASAESATDEFVELASLSAVPVNLTGWKLQYRAATAGADCTQGWATKITLTSGAAPAGGHYLLASSGAVHPDVLFPAGLAAAGTIRLIDAAGTPQDALAWGVSPCGSGSAAASPAPGQSLERRSGTDGARGDNSQDFFVQASPHPPRFGARCYHYHGPYRS